MNCELLFSMASHVAADINSNVLSDLRKLGMGSLEDLAKDRSM